jgi:SAM-dependent methyltransferase
MLEPALMSIEPFFYQSIDFPDGEFYSGQWDHRATTDVYLGHTDFRGKSVLDVGPGSGFWTFEMERRGADVIAIELSETDEWDMVPHGGSAPIGIMSAAVAGIQSAFWYSHAKLNSKAKVIRGSAYNAPQLVQPADIAIMGNVLQHLRDPFLAVERVARVTQERLIVSETLWIHDEAFLRSTMMHFFPRAGIPETSHSWYQVSPKLVSEWMKILGFSNTTVELHEQQFNGTPSDPNPRKVKHFTCVGVR